MTRQSTFFRERMYSGGFVLLYICVYEGDSHAPALLICFVCASVYFRKELIQIIMCFKKKMVAFIKENLRLMSKELTWSKVMAIVVGTAIASFGIYNIHRQSGITEGGVLGMILVLNHWFGVSNSILTSLLDLTCYALALDCVNIQHVCIFPALGTVPTGSAESERKSVSRKCARRTFCRNRSRDCRASGRIERWR